MQLALNMLSINTKKGIYVLAFRKLDFDVVHKTLRPSEEITICKEFTIDGSVQSIRKFLDADDYYLLEDYVANQEKIKDCIARSNADIYGVDDMPYFICIEKNPIIDLTTEYNAIINEYSEGTVSTPIKAFFGDLTEPSRRRKDYPITLFNNKVNLDQVIPIIHTEVKILVVGCLCRVNVGGVFKVKITVIVQGRIHPSLSFYAIVRSQSFPAAVTLIAHISYPFQS